jgi:AcrR family transcriptional regulator
MTKGECMKLINDFYNESRTKSKSRTLILEAATALFMQKGMERVTMTEIASKCEMTLRNIYRYYDTKEALIMDSAYYIFSYKKYVRKNVAYDNRTGLDLLRDNLFKLFSIKNNDEYLSFVQYIMYFDLFMSKLDNFHPAFIRYQSILRPVIDDSLYVELSEYLNIGILDGSIKVDEKEIDFYTAFISQSLFSLMMRVTMQRDLNPTIDETMITKQIDMIIDYLKQS